MGTRVDRIHGASSGIASDADLMARIRRADGDALDTLFRRYGRLVHRVAADILRDATEAEDVTQEVFLEIYRRAQLYDQTRGSVRVWVLQYAYHRSLRRKAALRRRVAYMSEPLETVQARGAAHPSQLTPVERRWVLRAGLAALTARQRTTLELACFEELSLRDVAERLGVSLGCVRHYFYRGLARLRAWARAARLHDPASLQTVRDPGPVSLEQAIELVPRQPELGRGTAGATAVSFDGRAHVRGRGQRAPRADTRQAADARRLRSMRIDAAEIIGEVLGRQP